MAVGVGTGVGEAAGVGEGLGVGVGVGVGLGDCACADDATAKKRMKTVATALASHRARPISVAREDRDAQPMNANPSPARQECQTPIAQGRFAPSSLGASIARGHRLEAIAGHCCSAAAISSLHRFPKPRQKLANTQISCCNTGHNRI